MRAWPITAWSWVSLGAIALVLGAVALPEPVQAGRNAYPQQIEVFTDRTRPVHIPSGLSEVLQARGIVVQVFDLDAPARLENRLSADLPAHPPQAERMARARLEAMGIEKLSERIQAAYQGLLLALDYGIDRYPAIVFDKGVGVVYGVTDLGQALKHYRRWQEERFNP
jgi:integrating conjugative element protein (TIGR03757 family)